MTARAALTDSRSFAPPARRGKQIVLGKNAKLPRVCVGCGTADGVRFKAQDFSWFPRWVLLLVPLIGIFVMFVVTRVTARARIAIPRCAKCKRGAQLAADLQGPVAIVVVVALIGAATAAFNGAPVLGAIALVIGLVTFAFAIYWIGRYAVWTSHIDRDLVTLGGIHETVLERLESEPRVQGGVEQKGGPEADASLSPRWMGSLPSVCTTLAESRPDLIPRARSPG